MKQSLTGQLVAIKNIIKQITTVLMTVINLIIIIRRMIIILEILAPTKNIKLSQNHY